MRYLVTLTPLEPYFFGGDTTFGALGDKENGSYLVKSRLFPQQSAILGMLKKEIMTQDGVLTRKVRGEWVDDNKVKKDRAKELVGNEKFDITKTEPQNFGFIKEISPLFLIRNGKRFIKKVAIDKFEYKEGLLKEYNPKEDIFDNYICLDKECSISSRVIFKPIEQIGNKKEPTEDDKKKENSLFKKTSYLLKHNFKFAFYLNVDFELKNSIVKLGGDGSKFKLEVQKDDNTLEYKDKNGFLTLLSDAYIKVPIKKHCEFAITSEISYQNLTGKKSSMTKNKDPKKNKQNNPFKKSEKIYFYEKGSVFINPSEELKKELDNPNLKKIGYNHAT